MALALFRKVEDPDLWRRTLTAEIPGLDFRVAPDLGDPTQVRMAAFDYKVPNGTLATMPNLGCIVYLGHGASDFLLRPDLPKGVPVMRLKDPGIIACMTEYVLLYLLSHRRLAATYRRYQADRRWQEDTPPFPSEVRVAILGLGSIGQRFAEVFVGLGYKVNGWARSRHQLPGVDCYHGPDQLAACLAPCDYVICILPETRETRDLVDARTLAMMKRGAYFISVGRGGLVVEEDLLAALDSGHLSGAALDVFRTEPLPTGSRLWMHPKVVVTPHAAGVGQQGSLPHIAENYRRLLDGRPLINIVDPARGY
jgi:glyoxylate/hydroxypyruvate reductase A